MDSSRGGTFVVTATCTPFVGPASRLAFSQQPADATAGSTLSPSPTVRILDASGTLVSSSTAAVTLAIGTNPASGTLSGTTTVNAVAGVATFPGLSLNNAGTGYTLSATSTGLTAATSNTFNITTPTPTPTLTFATPTAASVAMGGSLTNAATSSLPAGGAITYASATPGVATVNANTGAITPVGTGTSVITATQAASAGVNAVATQTYTLTVTAAVTATQPVASTTLTQNSATGVPFTPVTGSGGIGTRSFALYDAANSATATLPAGLSFSTSTGQITGTPTATSSATIYTVRVTDQSSPPATATATFSLTVNAPAVPAPTITGMSPATGTGAGGTEVTLTGTDFTGATSVTFGLVPASIIAVDSPTSLRVYSPPGSGNVNVRVTTPSGSSAPNGISDQFQYTASLAPGVTSLSVVDRREAGGDRVFIRGVNLDGATEVRFGTALATGLAVLSPNEIRVNTPRGVGTVEVTVTTPNGTSSTSGTFNDFTYARVPRVTGVSPPTGQVGTVLTITGTDFDAAGEVTFGQPLYGAVTRDITVNSPTSITLVVPAIIDRFGSFDVMVTTPGGRSLETDPGNDFSIPAPAPTVTALSRTTGPAAGGTTVTVTGTNFTGATAVAFGSTAATSFTVDSATTITATTPAGTGLVDVTVTTSSGTSATTGTGNDFTYGPTVTALSPNTGAFAGGTVVTLTGTGFTGATAVAFGTTAATSFTVNSATSITATAPAGTGTVNVTVTTPSGTSPSSGVGIGFTFVGAPTVTTLSPATGSVSGGTSVTLTGTNFTGATAVMFGTTAATAFTVNSATSIAATAPAGTDNVEVTVTTSGGVSSTAGSGNNYTYVVAAPTVTAISPSSGPDTGGTEVVVTGTNFTGATAVKFGATDATTFTVNSATSITATAPAGTGIQNILVTTPGGTTGAVPASRYTFMPPPPTVTGLSPSTGPLAGGTVVTVTGTNLTGGFVRFGSTNATSVTNVTATSLTATAPAGTGTVDVTVFTLGGLSDAAGTANDYTYAAVSDPTPTLTFATPTAASVAMGRTLTNAATSSLPAGGAITYASATPGVATVNSTTGAITPVGTGTSVITATQAASSGVNAQATQTYTLSVNAELTASASSASYTLTQNSGTGLPFTPVTGSGGTGTRAFALYNQANTAPATLPAGLSFSPSTGQITGSSTVAQGPTGYTVRVTDQSTNPATATAIFILVVNAPAADPTPTLTFATPTAASVAMGGALTNAATSSLPAGGAITYASATPGVATVNSTTGAITPVGTGTSVITATQAASAGVNAVATQTYTVTVSAAVSATQAVASTTLTQNSATGLPFTPVTGSGGLGTRSFALYSDDNLITDTLPAGLSFSTSTGQITGTPSEVTQGSYRYTVRVTDQSSPPATVTATFALTVNAPAADPTPTLTFATPTAASVAMGGALTNAATSSLPAGGAITYASATPGVATVNSTTGAITPVGTGTSVITATQAASAGVNSQATQTYTVTVRAAVSATQAVASATLTRDSAAGLPFAPVMGSGGIGTRSFALYDAANTATATLPAGLAFSTSTGQITGTPTATSAATTYTVRVTDQSSPPATATATFSLTVNAPAAPAPTVTRLSPATGPIAGGTVVTVTGTNFTGATAVRFSGVDATFTVNSATSITATAPAGSGTAQVTVTTPAGTNLTAGTGDDYVYTLDPIITSVSPATGTTAGGTVVTLTGVNFTGAVDVAVGGEQPASWALVNDTSITLTTRPGAAGRVAVAVETSAGTSNIADYTYTAPAADPTPTLTFATPTAASVAMGGTLTNAATSSLPAGGSITYASATPGVATVNSTTGAITPVGTGTSVITATQAASSGVNAQATQTYTLTVTAPGVTATAAVPSRTLTQLSAMGLPFTPVTGSGGTGTLTYALYNEANTNPSLMPQGLSFSTSTGQITGTPLGGTFTLGTFNYTVRVTDQSSPPATATAAFSLTVNAPAADPTPTLTFATPTSASVAMGGTLTNAATSSLPAGGAITYASATPGVATVNANTGAITPVGVGTSVITATQTASAGVNAVGTQTYTVTVSAAVSATQAVASTTLTQNSATGVPFTPVTGSGGLGTRSFALYDAANTATATLPAGLAFSTSTGQITGTPTATSSATTYTVRVTDQSSPPATATATFSLTVNAPAADPTPTLTFATPTSASVAMGRTLTNAATSSVPGGGAITYASATPGVAEVDSMGVIFPFSPGTSVITATQAASAGVNAVATQTFVVTVSPSLTATQAVARTTLIRDSAARLPFTPVTASGGTGTLTYALYNQANTAPATLPAGLSFSTSTGQITGTPTEIHAFTAYRVNVTDQSTTPATAFQLFLLNVEAPAADPTPTLTFATPTAASVAMGGTLTNAATSSLPAGGAITYASATPGVATVNSTTGVITPVGTGTSVITATQAASAGVNAQATQTYTLTVTAAAPTVTGLSPATGPTAGGTVVTVTGTNFTGATGVSFGATAATAFTVNSAASITATAPAGTGTVDVRVTTPGGTSATTGTGNDYAYAAAAAPTPTLTFATPTSASVVMGGTLTNAATSSIPAGGAITYASATPGVATVNANTGAITPVGVGTSVITATQTASAGVNAVGTQTYTLTVTAVVPPVAPTPAPTVSSISVSVDFNSPGEPIDLSVSGDYSSVSVSGAANGSVSVSGTTATYVPNRGYWGSDSFSYSATGPGGTSSAATVSISVAAPPPPVVTPPPPVPTTGGAGTDGGTGGGGTTVQTGSAVVDLFTATTGEVSDFIITVQAENGTAAIEVIQLGAPTMMQLGGARLYRLRYTPRAGFMGVDTVTVVAIGPGGRSSPAMFTFNVAGKAPDMSARVLANGSTTIRPTAGILGGPFQGLRIMRQPAFGTVTVSGLNIVFTPGMANAGATSLDYVVVLPFGNSAVGKIDLQSDPVPVVAPIAARTPAGRPVTVSLTATAQGGPFTAATVTGLSVPSAGTAVVTAGGTAGARTYDLTFTPAAAFAGRVDVTFTLSNAFATSTGVVQVTVVARPDPSLDPDVRALVSSQSDAARRFARTQTDNFNQRLERIRDGDNRSTNALSLNMSALQTIAREPNVELQQRLGVQLDAEGLSPRDRANLDEDRVFLARFSAHRAERARPVTPDDEGVRLAGAPGEDGPPSRVGVWAGGSLDWGRRDAEGLRDTRLRTSGLSAGVDVKVDDALILGGGIGYGSDSASIGELGTDSDSQTTVGVLYGGWRAGQNLHLAGLIGHGTLDYDTRRWSTDASAFALGERSGSMTFGSVSLAWDRRTAGASQSLYGRMEASRASLDAFNETGAGIYALGYEAMDMDTLTGNLGVRMDWLVQRRDMTLAPSVRIEWRHEFDQPDDQTVTYADWLASPRYGVRQEGWSRDSLAIEVGGRWTVGDQVELETAYRATLGSNTASQGVQVRLTTRF